MADLGHAGTVIFPRLRKPTLRSSWKPCAGIWPPAPSPFKDLFDQENRAALGEASHVGLLWALEHLAWSREHFAMAAKMLAGLAEIDPGWEAGRVTTRPAESLRGVSSFRAFGSRKSLTTTVWKRSRRCWPPLPERFGRY